MLARQQRHQHEAHELALVEKPIVEIARDVAQALGDPQQVGVDRVRALSGSAVAGCHAGPFLYRIRDRPGGASAGGERRHRERRGPARALLHLMPFEPPGQLA